MKTLLVGELDSEAISLLEDNVDLVKVDNLSGRRDFSEYSAVVLRTFTKLDKRALDKFPDLKYVVSCSIGVDNIDLSELQKKKIELINCSGTNSNAVAEHTLHLILSLCRLKKPFFELNGKTIGIIGLGHIGKLVAKKLLGFGAKVIAFDVLEQDPAILGELNVEMKPFDEVVQKADILSVHVPLNDHTDQLIGKDVFGCMKENSFFVNTSRAEVVDEAALVKFSSKFRGIALDVYSDKLKKKLGKNVFITGHVAAQGEDSFKKMCLDPVKQFLDRLPS